MDDLKIEDQTLAGTSAEPLSDASASGTEPESHGDTLPGELAQQDEPQAEAGPAEAPPAPVLIVPTIGRRVWYWPSVDDIEHSYDPVLKQLGKDQAMDAGIVFVHDERRVNLSVKDHWGKSFARLNVLLLQDGEPIPSGGGYAVWMPYQKASAASKA